MYFLEAGLLLVVVPWSAFWDRNLFVRWWPALGAWLGNHFVRGAVSGVGVVCLGAAAAEFFGFFGGRGAGAGPDPQVAASLERVGPDRT